MEPSVDMNDDRVVIDNDGNGPNVGDRFESLLLLFVIVSLFAVVVDSSMTGNGGTSIGVAAVDVINGVDGGARVIGASSGGSAGEESVCSIYGDGGAVARSGKIDGNIAAPINGVNPDAGRLLLTRRASLLLLLLLPLVLVAIEGGLVTRIRPSVDVGDGDAKPATSDDGRRLAVRLLERLVPGIGDAGSEPGRL
jgi:hypothetical protein